MWKNIQRSNVSNIGTPKASRYSKLEGHSDVPSEEELENYLSNLGPDEDPYKNMPLEKHENCSNIASFFRREHK